MPSYRLQELFHDLREGVPAINQDNGPTVHSSTFSSYQDALNAAAGGHLFIDDTKREEGIQIGTQHAGTVIEWVGNNWVEKPSAPTDGEATFRLEDGLTADVEDITFIRPRIRNPDLADADIDNEDTRAGADRRSAIETHPPNGPAQGDCSPVRWHVVAPVIHHVQGYGVAIQQPKESATVRNGTVRRTAYDNYYTRTASSVAGVEGVEIAYRDCVALWSGRHNFAMAGDAIEGAAHISGRGEDAYTAGVDLEKAANVELAAVVENPARSGGSNNVDSGINVSPGSSLGGIIKIVGSNNHSAHLGAAELHDLTVVYDQPVGENPNGVYEVTAPAGASGSLTVKGSGGGRAVGAVNVGTNSDQQDLLKLVAEVRDAYGPSVRLGRAQKHQAEVLSIDPVQGAGNISAAYQCHVMLDGTSTLATDNIVDVTAGDADGNAAYGVSSDGNSDYNTIRGNVRGAYSSAATNALGSNTDTTDLMT